LRDQFTPQGIVFWMIDSNAADNRSNIVTQANALGLTSRFSMIARSSSPTPFMLPALPKWFASINWAGPFFYRGTIDDRMGSTPVADHPELPVECFDRFSGRGNG